jgi:hypothetical protein
MSHTGTRTRVRPHPLRPAGHDLLDLFFVVLLSGVALSGLAASFTGWEFLAVGMVGVVLGVVVTHLARAAGWPLVAAVVILMGLFLLLGGPLTLRSTGDTAFLPGGSTLSALLDQVVHGWKDLLTTLPPVDGDGPLLVLPWAMGLVSGLVGTALAAADVRRSWLSALLPVLGITAVAAGVILLGVRHPHSLVVQGAVHAALALGWIAVRARRASASVRGGASRWSTAVAGTALVALAAGLALPASALVAGDDAERAVLREWVEPPFDIGRYPSPLAGFRRYVDLGGRSSPGNVHDRTLLTIDGVEPGTRLRLATMDAYDGLVWGATNDALPGPGNDSYQRVSSTIDNPVDGTPVEATITLGEGYDGVWLPTVGALTSLEFLSGDPELKAESFRYNLATSSAVVPSGLHEGDSYRLTGVLPDDSLTQRAVASGELVVPSADTAFLDEPASSWSGKATSPIRRVLAIAEHLEREGKYSDGVTRTEARYLAGHSINRLSDEFVNAQQMVGNDEQYAAVMALLAIKVGVPARVVLGAEVPEDGVVRGEHVEAWVELRLADGTWATLPTERFMSRQPPATQLPETTQPMTGTVVPPPAPIPPPTDAGEQSDADLKERRADERDKEEHDDEDTVLPDLPSWLVRVLTFAGVPLLLATVVIGAILLAKALRRHRRRTHASVSARFVGGWRELVDHARDLGHAVPLGPTVTRREQSGSIGSIGSGQASGLARRADSFVFGPRIPEEAAAASYWDRVDAERRAMSDQATRGRRLRAAVSPASLRRR